LGKLGVSNRKRNGYGNLFGIGETKRQSGNSNGLKTIRLNGDD